MICILSQSYNEPVTEGVLLWLESRGVPSFRLNADDVFRREGPEFSFRDGNVDFEIEISGSRVRASDVDVVWHRRWSNFDVSDASSPDLFGGGSSRDFNLAAEADYFQRERAAVYRMLFASFRNAVWLNAPSKTYGLDKMKVLCEAQRCGLDVPDTIVTGNPTSVERFVEKHGEAICKSASDLGIFMLDGTPYAPITRSVTKQTLASLGWKGMFPSLFQECLRRSYELRIFYLDGRCYSWAYVFLDPEAAPIDGRVTERLRSTPFVLPEAVQARLVALMRSLQIDVACIDMVRTRDDRWVFLEANPSGQFWSDDRAVNHHLERELAEALIAKLNARRTQRKEN